MNINLSALKARIFSKETESGNRQSEGSPFSGENQFKDMDILDHIERIVELAKKYGIEKCQVKGNEHVKYVTGKLGISPLQAVLFSLIMEQASSNRIKLSEIAEDVKISKVRIIKYMTECEVLEKLKLIRCSRGDCTTYRIPREVRESLRTNNEYYLASNENVCIAKFFTVLGKLFGERENEELTYKAMSTELLDLINQNMHLEFCKKILSYNFEDDDRNLLLCFCHLAGNNNDDLIMPHNIEYLYEDKDQFLGHKLALNRGKHILIESKLIDFSDDENFLNNDSWKLTDKAKKELLSELNLRVNQSYLKNLILYDKIKVKKMFYNTRETKKIDTLSSLLSEKNFRKIQKRLDGKGMRKGFACLFSGEPGTGKTETAYQIAKKTRRNIMMVDLSQTKSMWVGQSEKKVKEIFDTYRHAVDNSKIAPILLFNEADGIIGRRMEFNSASRAVDQMENTVQNIILQEMETLSGIMIATTNLTCNMDSAFERRFLYKISFDRPGMESRKGIWNALMPDLPEEQADELSGKFDLSGGQIENIARKAEVDAIIQGGDINMDSLQQYCRDEINNSFNEKTKRIGFGQ